MRDALCPRTKTLLGDITRPKPVTILPWGEHNATLILIAPPGKGRRNAPLNFPVAAWVLLADSYLRNSEEKDAPQTYRLAVMLPMTTRLPFVKGSLDKRRRCLV